MSDLPQRPRSICAGFVLATIALVAAVPAMLVLQAGGSSGSAERVAASPRLALGVTTDALARNSYRRWRNLAEVRDFERRARRAADIVMWFSDWTVRDFNAHQAAAVYAHGSVPEITWEPWNSLKGPRRPQPAYRLARIIRGHFDGYVRRWARQIKAFRKPVRLRFAQEMNGNWYPWSEQFNANRRGEYVRAWRRVRTLFRQERAFNVVWIWSPVVGRPRPDLYPGHRHVDELGVSGFNGGTMLFRHRWLPFKTAFGATLVWLHALAPKKPVVLSEVGSAERGGNKALWITRMFDEIRRRPYITALVWFNLRKQADWRIESSRRAEEAFARGINRLP